MAWFSSDRLVSDGKPWQKTSFKYVAVFFQNQIQQYATMLWGQEAIFWARHGPGQEADSTLRYEPGHIWTSSVTLTDYVYWLHSHRAQWRTQTRIPDQLVQLEKKLAQSVFMCVLKYE